MPFVPLSVLAKPVMKKTPEITIESLRVKMSRFEVASALYVDSMYTASYITQAELCGDARRALGEVRLDSCVAGAAVTRTPLKTIRIFTFASPTFFA